MAKYLIQGSYTVEGIRGLLEEGGTSRTAAVEKALNSAGATLDGIYYCLGGDDVACIVDAPDNVSIAGMSLRIAAAGLVSIRTTALLTPEEIDEACKQTVDYRPPGQ